MAKPAWVSFLRLTFTHQPQGAQESLTHGGQPEMRRIKLYLENSAFIETKSF